METLQAVRQWMVTPENPPQQVDGLDFARCIALHNAILEYAWVKSGRSLEGFRNQSQTWGEYHAEDIEEFQDRFHPSVRSFLEGALVLPYELGDDRQSFFYSLMGLHTPEMFFQHEGEENLLTLYAGQDKFASSPDGLIYDQETHEAATHWDVEDDFDITLTGQKLECFLTVYIEMMLRGKIVALHDNVDRHPLYQRAEDGSLRMVPRGPERDPETGAKRLHSQLDPWTAVSWTPKDLADCLNVWKMLVESVESKMSLSSHDPEHGIYSDQISEAAGIPNGFAREFLTKAQKPRFRFIAPGLRLLDDSEFISQPFREAHQQEYLTASREGDVMPILLFRGEDMVSTSQLKFGWPYSDVGPHKALAKDCPVGLYFDPCMKSTGLPFEDACRLILAFGFSGRWARHSDQTPVRQCDDLLKAGTNPYIQPHGPQLQAVLENAYMNVERGHWQVDENGVSGGIDVWKDADTEERWRSYWIPIGPGRFW